MAIYKFEDLGVDNSKVKSLGLPNQNSNSTEDSPNFLSSLKADFNKRDQNVFKAKQKVQSGQQSLGSGLLQSTGQAAGLAGDVATNALSSVTPQPVKDVASSFASSIAGTEPAQRAIQSYEQLKKSNPEAVANLEAVFNIATLIPALKGGQIAGQGAKTAVKGVVSTGVDTAKATSVVAKKVGQGVSEATLSVAKPENIMQRVARIPKGAQAKFEQTSGGESVGKYLNKRNIYGNTEEISQKLYDRFSKSKNTADKAIAELPGTYKPTSLRTALKELLDREKRVSSPGALSPDFKRTRELGNKFNKDGLTMSEINEAKRLFEKNVRLDFVKQNLPEGVARATNVDNSLREWQFAQAEKLGLKNLPEINKETRLAKQLLDAIGKESAGSAGNNALTLTDYILLAGGDPTAIGAFIGKKALSAKGVQSAIAKKLYKGEKVGLPKAQKGKPRPGFKDLVAKYSK
jgi:hypothetical protein